MNTEEMNGVAKIYYRDEIRPEFIVCKDVLVEAEFTYLKRPKDILVSRLDENLNLKLHTDNIASIAFRKELYINLVEMQSKDTIDKYMPAVDSKNATCNKKSQRPVWDNYLSR